MTKLGYRFFTVSGAHTKKYFALEVKMIDALNSSQMPLQLDSARDKALWSAAQKLEATFLSEMLKSTGLGEVNDSFGGGVGEEQFASFLRGAQADQMVAAGGVGLAESIFHSLKETDRGSV